MLRRRRKHSDNAVGEAAKGSQQPTRAEAVKKNDQMSPQLLSLLPHLHLHLNAEKGVERERGSLRCLTL